MIKTITVDDKKNEDQEAKRKEEIRHSNKKIIQIDIFFVDAHCDPFSQ